MKNYTSHGVGKTSTLVSVSMTEYIFVISCGFWSCDTGRVTAAAAAITYKARPELGCWARNNSLGVKDEHGFTQITCHSRVPNKSTTVLFMSAPKKSIFNEGNFGRKVFSYQPDIQATPPPGNQTWAILRVRFYNIVKSTNLDCGLSARCCRRSEGSWLGLGGLYNVIRAGSVKNKGREVLVGGQLDLQRLMIFKSTPFAGHNTAKGGCTPNGEIFEFYVNLWKHTMHTCLIKYKKKWCVNC